MDLFLKWFFAFITTMFNGIATIFVGIFTGIVQTFNVVEYYRIFKTYGESFGFFEWVAAIVATIIVIAIWGLIFFMLFLVIRKYVRFRKSIVTQEDLLEEFNEMHKEVIRLTQEKEKILGMKAEALGVPVSSILDQVAKDSSTGSAPAANAGPPNGATRFQRLTEVDEKYKHYIAPSYETSMSLEEICETYRNFCCSRMNLYYNIRTIRLVFAGIAAAKMILLQGISGTGKTSLPYSLGKFLENDSTVASVQPSWRDRTELFGYYNEFTKKFNETEVLRRIYEASYNDDINVIILDEMNIARVEYYFAEMLSILEMPDHSEWKVDLVTSTLPSDPERLIDGKLQIPSNVWYVGTANNDDSTFAVSDKVYDRAVAINLDAKGEAFDAPDTGPVNIPASYMEKLFDKACEEYPVSKENMEKIKRLDVFVIEKLRIAFGNRIIKQMKRFVPVYVACGGSEIDGIDYILATKVFRKFESLNLTLVREELKELSLYLNKVFGKNNMTECKEFLERLQKLI